MKSFGFLEQNILQGFLSIMVIQKNNINLLMKEKEIKIKTYFDVTKL